MALQYIIDIGLWNEIHKPHSMGLEIHGSQ